jgi:hypothetical protein
MDFASPNGPAVLGFVELTLIRNAEQHPGSYEIRNAFMLAGSAPVQGLWKR